MIAAARRPARSCLAGALPRWSWREAATSARRAGGAASGDEGAAGGQTQQEAVREPLARSISVHKGLKIQAALCIERPPLEVLEPDFKQRWRAFTEAWERRTSNALSLSDELIFMRFHFHFYGDEVATRAVARGGTAQIGASRAGPAGRSRGAIAAASSTSAALASSGALAGMGSGGDVGLSSIISQEGINLQFPEAQKSGAKRKVVKERVREAAHDSDMRSLLRLSASSLFLLVRYGSGKAWTFPKADRVHGQGMQETLLRLCSRQLAPAPEPPYMVGACPFAYRKRQGTQLPGVEGRKIFYYKAKWVPGSQLMPPQDGSVEDWAWCSRAELPLYLRPGEWHAIRHGVPLDHLA